jgi:uncharacterized protein YlzI (FlbEa/FlbD family)
MYKVTRLNETNLIMRSAEDEKISDNVGLPYSVDKEFIQDVIDRILEYGPEYIEIVNAVNKNFPTKSKRYPR